MGPMAMKYWENFDKNFGKLATCARFIFKAPGSSSAIERVFSQISRRIGTNSTRTLSETLVVLNQSNHLSDKFILRLKNFCTRNNISFD